MGDGRHDHRADRLSAKLHRAGQIDIVLIGTAVCCMAISRYLVR